MKLKLYDTKPPGCTIPTKNQGEKRKTEKKKKKRKEKKKATRIKILLESPFGLSSHIQDC